MDEQGQCTNFGAHIEAIQFVESKRSGHHFDICKKGRSEISHHWESCSSGLPWMDQSHLKVSHKLNTPQIQFFSLVLCEWVMSLFVCRSPEDEKKGVEQYKADVRRRLVNGGYHIWGIVGDQYSSIQGSPSGRTFKLPNPMYYVY